MGGDEIAQCFSINRLKVLCSKEKCACVTGGKFLSIRIIFLEGRIYHVESQSSGLNFTS